MTIVEFIGVGLLAAFSLGLLLLLKRGLTRPKNSESTPRPVVYDKAEHHLLDEELQSQEGFNAYIYGGMYLGWIIGSGLHSPEYFERNASLLERFRARKATVSELYGAVGEALFSNMLSEKGNLFTASLLREWLPPRLRGGSGFWGDGLRTRGRHLG